MEDGLSRQALAASRALAAAGWTVGVAAQLRRGMSACSTATAHVHRAPAPQLDAEGFVAAANRAIEEVGYELVFGARDADILALSARREDLRAVVPYPPHDTLLRVLDKVELEAAAEAVGVPIPPTVAASDDALDDARLPVIVKARAHARLGGHDKPPPRLETRVAGTREQAGRFTRGMRMAGGQPLLQEHRDGRLCAFVVLADADSRIVAQLQQEASDVWPLGAGVSVRARTVPPDRALAEMAAALVDELSWFGLAELQFLIDDDGDPRLIDFNGRFYGSLALALGAGLNLPAMWAAMATRRPLGPSRQATPGVRYQWLYGDLRRCWDLGRPGVAGRMVDSIRYARGAVQSVFRWRDPLPAVRHFAVVVPSALGKRLPWTRSR
jgi:predicted ATP-grasp superfamily ATP-dependent carboligase